MSIKKIGKELKEMSKYLKTRPDEKIIEGYKKAMQDYKDTGDEKCKTAAEVIKREIDRRGLETD